MPVSDVPVPETFRFEDDGQAPNHPRFPVLLYRAVESPHGDAADAFEARFAGNRWPPRWRDGIYPYHHYHADTHEAFGIAAGRARLRLGGEAGCDVELGAGDALVLPAGTAHCGLWASDDFVAVGAYPGDVDVDMQRVSEPVPDPVRARIRAVPPPEADPIAGPGGALLRLWRPD